MKRWIKCPPRWRLAAADWPVATTISHMCRNIRTLYNFEPPASEDEVRGAALQYVRKISGFTKPSQANAAAFERAIEEVAEISGRLLERARHLGAAEGPRGRGGEAQGTERAALRGVARITERRSPTRLRRQLRRTTVRIRDRLPS